MTVTKIKAHIYTYIIKTELRINTSNKLTGIIVGSKARWIAAGSPPESTARRANSKTGRGGHQISSSSSLRLRPPFLSELKLLPLGGLWGTDVVKLGVKGTRNLKQELSSRATIGLTVEERDLGPRRESKSEGVAFGVVGAGDDNENGLNENEEPEREKERERKIVNLSERERLPIYSPSLCLTELFSPLLLSRLD